jgi:hypothetical protein
MKTFENVLDEANEAFPFVIHSQRIERGQSLAIPLPTLPLGNSAIAYRYMVILIDATQNADTQLALLYHELGHLWSDLRQKRETEYEREIDANNWSLQKMIDDGMKELAQTTVRHMKDMLDKGEAIGVYQDVYRQVTEGEWKSLL